MVAVKKMKDVPTTEEEGEIAMREVRVLQLAKHVNIVNLLEAYKSQSGRLYLVFEYVERTLLQELKANRGGMPPAAVKSLTWQLLQSLSYLHRKQIIHRDVKPSNILITETGVLKICDFGFARAMTSSSADPAYTTYVVTRWYRAPEVLVGDNYGPPVDVWALGCIFAEMLAGRPLFPGKNHHDQLWLILKCLGTMTERQLELLDSDPQFACFRLPTQSEIEPLEHRLSNLSGPAMQFLRACLNPDPKQRATADELLAMPYFAGVTDVLPVDDLMAYPDADLRAKMEKALAQDAAAAAAAAQRETLLLMPSTSKRGMLAPTNSKQHMNPHLNGQAVSPGRNGAGLPPPAQHQQQHQQPLLQPHSSQPMAGPLPSKAASVQQLSAAPITEARPPLQRYITAPAGSIASKVMSQPPPLQPLSQHGGYSQVPQPQQRSRPSSGGGNTSQQPSPSGSSVSKASSQQQVGPPGPVRDERDRERERVPPSGSALVPSGMNGMGLGGGMPMGHSRPTRGTWRFSGDGEAGLPPTITRQLSGTVNFQTYSGAASGTGATAEQGRGGPDHVTPSLRAPQQRTTWNGAASAAQPSQRNAASNGGGSNNTSNSGQEQGQSRSSSMNGQEQGSSTAAHRKAHSLAGNEGLHVNGGGGGGSTMRNGLTGLQGRSLAPVPAGSSAQPQSTHAGFPSTNAAVRFSPSPPPGSYGGPLRSANSAPMVPAPGSQGRASHDGMGNGSAGQLLMGPSVHGISIVAGGGGKSSNSGFMPQPGYSGNNSSTHAAGSLLEPEASDSSCYADASAYLNNDGRRASDTVLYAAAALKEAKHRLDKASNMISGTNRQPGLLDGVPVANGGAVGGTLDGGSRSVGLGVLRAPSFGRASGPHTGIPNGPPSPDSTAPSNLPPLMGGTPRRISAPESSTTSGALAALNGASGGGNGASGAGNGSSTSRAPMGSSHPPSGGGYLQRHNIKQQHHQQSHQQQAQAQHHQHHQNQQQQQQSHLHGQASAQLLSMGSGDSDEGAQGAGTNSNGASHGTFLPALEVGKPGSRIPSASSLGPTSGVGVGRRPSKGSLRSAGPEAAHCKREEAMKALALEAVPEAGVL
ncbi:hypothetical protein HXX76_002933 [Chlamydomonas incerta]|uniref:Protein kinase domain-containing protein n=1 Tax=Chlamydomonas incerta TaxID=51695 RepID=A0A835TCF3_CHLIN|nr:hypothetical protein HXX76_002933 [Chlamydomonas incerta]|eukprot:KAG2442854.1 hypothetical protein HXX76_002933 [Chlamydomonas incerta]